MNIRLLTVLMILVLAVTNVGAADDKPTTQENVILALMLRQSHPDGGYFVVSPEARISDIDAGDSKGVNQSKKYIVEHLQISGLDIAKLVNRLFERNLKPVRQSIRSSREDGYIVDYDGKYGKYFEKGGGGWEKWYKENPKAHGFTMLSLPIYDLKNGVVLIYKGVQAQELMGAGWIILYKYENGLLRELKKVNLWVS
ncbi:MAG TPA: hypothetical protein HPP97_11050 [Desulfuromonadales bacterium]|nr:hypothetical protein [Desulfuromonadales bacterium]